MSTVQIRRALAGDQPTINQLVREAQLDPTSLHWSHFIVAEADGQIVGIGQVRPYPRCRELGSLVVRKKYRKQGVGGMLINALLAEETGDVYLECQLKLAPFYEPFGFRRIPWYAAPYPLNLKAGLGGLFIRLIYRVEVITMRRAATGKGAQC